MEPRMRLELTDIVDPQHTALVIVDMQNDFCTPGFGAARAGRNLSMARAVVPQIARLVEAARASGVLIAHIGLGTEPDHGSDSGPWLAQRRRATASSDNLCIRGTEGAAFIDELKPLPGEIALTKRRYSAFTGTELDLRLRARRIETLVVSGVSTNACVETTARAGFELDYYICVPPDACGSWDRNLHEATLANIRHRFGLTPSIDQIIGIWQQSEQGQAGW